MKVKFCGGCNPLYDRKKVYEKLLQNKELAEKDINIILNGCQRGCIQDENFEINSQEFILANSGKEINKQNLYEWIVKNKK